MEDPSSLDPHHPPPLFDDHLQDDHGPLLIPPLDDPNAMLNGELSFPDECVTSDFQLEDYLDFNFDELDFAADVLLGRGSDANSGSSDDPGNDQNHSISQPPVSDPAPYPVPGSHVVEGLDLGFNDQGFKEVEVSNSEMNLDTVAPRVSEESTLAPGNNSDLDSSVHVPRPESLDPGSNGSTCSNERRVGCEFNHKLSHFSPESVSCEQLSSQGSGDSNSGLSPGDNPRSPDSCQSARDVSSYFKDVHKKELKYSPNKSGNCEVKVEDTACKFVPKRKKDREDEHSDDSRTSKSRKSSVHVDDANSNGAFHVGPEEDKKKARLMRNRESAQLSRQRKKQYVEELEDKVRSMHATITDLNSRISYIMAENAALRQQVSGGSVCPPPPPGMYPMAPMGYPWMPCHPYVMKPQGSHVPLVPIPRLKSQQPAAAPKANRKMEKMESKKGEGKTKKVASISFLGLLFFFLLFGGLVPMINLRYGGGIGDSFNFSSRSSDTHKGRILILDGGLNRSGHVGGRVYSDGNYNHKNGVLHGDKSGRNRLQQDHLPQSSEETGDDGSVSGSNSSEPLVASLYVPRNDKLVQIDGNLIIHSVLASERATSSSDGKGLEKGGKDTSLAIARNYVPAYHVSGRQRALGSGAGDNSKLPANDGRLQQWFREGLAGPLLSSGMCTEVFQFNISPTPGSIVPATPVANKTTESRQNSTQPNKSARNRRFLHGHPISLNNAHALNLTDQHNMEPSVDNVGLDGNKSSSMVVSVLMDPREAGDGEGETVMRSKSHSRIFVVVLIDGVKYVTYSCMLPLMGSGHHLVTA